MAEAAAQDWNLEHTDAKGYWVSTPAAVDSRTEFPASDLDVPEFTLSGADPEERPLEGWEMVDTQIPDDAFESPVNDDPTPKGPRVANVLVAREPSQPTPVAEAPTPAPAPVETPADPKAIAAELARKAASGTLTLEERRALALKMVAAARKQPGTPAPAVVRLDDHRPPGTLPPMEELPEAHRESWSWDEADPLAVAEGPSLSVVKATDDETYDDYLATPLPAPPRPSLQLPWPLPVPRSRLEGPSVLPATPDATDLVELDVALVADAPETRPAPRGSVLPWLVLLAGVTMLLGVVLVGTMGLTVVTGLVAMALLG